jgi:surface-anchored protein
MKASKLKSLLAVALASPVAVSLNAQTLLTEGHTDVGVVYELGAWNLHIGQHEATPPMEYAPNEAILGVDIVGAHSMVPANPQFSFLGTAGSSVWVLPQVQDPALLFLGFGTEELESGVFVNDEVTVSLQGLTAPGQFSVYEVGMFGSPTIFMNSGDGITAADSILLAAGGHRHVNWAFSTPGTYELNFAAAGTLVDGNVFTASGPITYTFSVAAVPEPSALSLLVLGGAGLLAFARRTNSRN